MREDLSVAVPAAVDGGAATGWVVSAYLTEEPLPALGHAPCPALSQVQPRVALALLGREAELAHPMHLHEGQVKLQGRRRLRLGPSTQAT